MKSVILFVIAAFAMGCSHPVALRKQQTTVTYSDRLPAKVGLFMSSDVKSNSLAVPGSGDCAGHKYPMEFGASLSDAIQTGVETACNEVVILSSMPNASAMQAQSLKFVITPRLNNANGDVSFSSQIFSAATCKATFQASTTLSVTDATGKTFYSFTANGTGLNSSTASCPGGSEILARATEQALQQIADNIAQTLNSNAQIRDAATK